MAAFCPMAERATVIRAGFVRKQLGGDVRFEVGVARRSDRTDNPLPIPSKSFVS
jgi:hypothetical protein